MTIWTTPRLEPESMPLSAFPATRGESLGAAAAEELRELPVVQAAKIHELQAASGEAEDLGGMIARVEAGEDPGEVAFGARPAVPQTPIAEARARVKAEGLDTALKLPDAPAIATPALDIMIERARERRSREQVVLRGPQDILQGAVNLGTAFLVQAVDPLNIASAFIPVVGELRYGKMLAEAGGSYAARAGVAARIGAASGAIGVAALQPIDIRSRTLEGQDWHFAHAAQNVLLGAALGGVLMGGTRLAGDVMRSRSGRQLYPFAPGELFGPGPDAPPLPRAAIETDIASRLRAAGLADDEVAANAAIVAARYAARGERLGMDPLALYRAEGIDIRRGEAAEAAAGDRSFDQDATAPGFYSAVERSIEALPQPRASGEQWLATLRNRPGVKAEEIEWLGLEEWLKGQQGPVSREALLDYVSAHRIEVKETTLRNAHELAGPEREALQDRLAELEHQIETRGVENTPLELMQEFERLDALVGPGVAPAGGRATMYQSMALPGGRNYRELLLTLPERGDSRTLARLSREHADALEEGNYYRAEDLAELMERAAAEIGEDFRGGHWREPNILASVRVDERTIGGQRTLFVMEIQSDWHQAGGKHGYRGHSNAEAAARLREVEDQLAALETQRGTAEFALLDIERAMLRGTLNADGGVPNAPFKTTWHELAIKRVLRLAAEEGYDQVAWPGSAETVARVEKWGEIKQDGDKWMRGSQNVTAIVNRYLGDLPRFASKLGKKFGAPVGRSEIASGDAYSYIVRNRAGEEVNRFHDESAARRRADAIRGTVEEHQQAASNPVFTLPITPELRRAALAEGFPLFQAGGDGAPRGRITLSDGRAMIDLFARADRSTFMHEMSHLWLDELVRDAARAGVPQALKDDLGTVLRWLGVDKAEDIGVAQQEQWARGFEAYLAEGKAPSNALAGAFENFKRWLLDIYESLASLGRPVADDVRAVMDRMLASDAEIAAREAGAPTPTIRAIADLPPRAQEDAMRASVAALVDGRPVRAGELLEAAAEVDPRIAESLAPPEPPGPSAQEGAAAAADAVQVRPRKVRGRAAADPATFSIFEFLAWRGGLKPDPDLAYLLDGNPFVPGFGRLVRRDGLDLDNAWRELVEAGYIADPTAFDMTRVTATGHRELFALIEAEARGTRQYRIGADRTESAAQRAHDLEREAHDFERELIGRIEDAGFEKPELPDALMRRVREMVEKEGETDWALAYERALIEDGSRSEGLRDVQRDAIGESIPGWDEPDARAASPTRGELPPGRGGPRPLRGGSEEGPGAGDPPREFRGVPGTPSVETRLQTAWRRLSEGPAPHEEPDIAAAIEAARRAEAPATSRLAGPGEPQSPAVRAALEAERAEAQLYEAELAAGAYPDADRVALNEALNRIDQERDARVALVREGAACLTAGFGAMARVAAGAAP